MQSSANHHILLVYPKLGLAGELVQHLPLSLLYAVAETVKAGYDVDILDVRLDPGHWRQNLEAKLRPQTMLVGLSVLTGTPILNALEISRYLRAHHPQVKVVWGGPHASFNALDILGEPAVDYVISGYGSRALHLLVEHLAAGGDPGGLEAIPGLGYRLEGQPRLVPRMPEFEFIDHRDIPYHLVEPDLDRYGQLGVQERIFSMYSAIGCPYQCAFCSSPALYRQITKKYVPLPRQEVVDHVQMVHEKYGANYIYFIDDDSFVDLGHVEGLITEIKRRGIKVRLGFRGARVNEIMRMNDEFLSLLASSGTDILHIGAESGSPRMLKLFNKNCTVEDIIAINRKLARHPEITAAYNWVVGVPGETLEDLRATQRLILRLLADNPSAIMFTPNVLRPLPGTSLFELALQHGYKPPSRLEEWAEIEVEGAFALPWISAEQESVISMMRIASYFVDDKINKVKVGNNLRYKLVRLLSKVYTPLAKFRFRHNLHRLMPEKAIYRLAVLLSHRTS